MASDGAVNSLQEILGEELSTESGMCFLDPLIFLNLLAA